jgi:hypothetical protein
MTRVFVVGPVPGVLVGTGKSTITVAAHFVVLRLSRMPLIRMVVVVMHGDTPSVA